MPVEFRCAAVRGRAYTRGLRADAERLMRAAGLDACELSLTMLGDRAMRALNRKFRGTDAPTDVLAFSQIEEAGRRPPNPRTVRNRAGLPLGDVVISIETAIRQAREAGITPAARLRTLLIHGFLHLLGYDHERSAAAARRMRARERVLAARMRKAAR